MMRGRVQDKVAIITGAGTGIGRETGILFAREGAKVVVTDVDEERSRAVAAEIAWSGGETLSLRLDVSDESQWKGVVAETIKRFGTIDVLYNNAGIYVVKPLAEIESETWNKLYGINVAGTFLGLKHVLPVMAKNGGGSVINCSSMEALIGGPGHVMNGSSQGAVRALTRHAAAEYVHQNVRINSVYLGRIKTGMVDYALKALGVDEDSLEEGDPMGRPGTPLEMAYLVLFLASDESAYCTGAEFVADGGITLAGASRIGHAVMRPRNHAMDPSDRTGEPAERHAHLSLVATVAHAGCISEQGSSIKPVISLEEKL
jgi:NAD(P)-dependent dehydrogenase (short-subunit alcohol dehydrogenase family)